MIGNITKENAVAHIWTEGKTDWKHLKRAMEALKLNLDIYIEECESDMGGPKLLRQCKNHSEIPHPIPMIFVFDCDDREVVKQATHKDKKYKYWGNSVYSFVLPVPAHREDFENLSIELYYIDDEIATEDENGRRLFLSSEFHPKSGRHKKDTNIGVTNFHHIKEFTEKKKAKIIDSGVFDKHHESIALSKEHFATNISNAIPPFDNFDFEEFRKIFDIIELIIQDATPKLNICLSGLEQFFQWLVDMEASEKLPLTLETIMKVFRLTSLLFCAATIRFYEEDIVDEPVELRKKVRPIKNILAENFREPSLRVLQKLTRYCFHLIDDSAPRELLLMRACFDETIKLEAVGHLLDDLEQIFPPRQYARKTKERIKNKADIKKQVLDYVFPELAGYETRLSDLKEYFENEGEVNNLSPSTWQQALERLIQIFTPLFTNSYSLKNIERIDPKSEMYILSTKTYRQGRVITSDEHISVEEFEIYQQNFSELLISDSKDQETLHLFPFLVINDDRLCFFKRTRAVGYEYHSIFDNHIFTIQTKKKFSRSVFKAASASRQALFWTEVLPSTNEKNGITDNVPFDELDNFVGRKKQLERVIEEIIEIPNQNGIIFGQGGVGKTALMLQLSQQLREEDDPERLFFDNIIWISAKSDYYDPVFDVVEKRKQQFKSLEHIFTAIFDFFEYDSMDEYDFEDKKELILELVKEHRILLILDNFETINQKEREKIITFFGIEAKKSLKDKPDFFKVIVTSREQIPCGFHQIRLEGLGLRESKNLMKQILERYKDSKEELSIEQQEKIYKVTSGIPIVIKHCIGQKYEYNRPIDAILKGLSGATNNVVNFSFAEIFDVLKKDSFHLDIILLLESINCPLMVRQIGEILEVDEAMLETRISSLENFQIIKTTNQGEDEKYLINDEVRFFTKRLAQEHYEAVRSIRRKITDNFTIERSLDYTTEELSQLYVFDRFISEKRLLEGEDFIKSQLRKYPRSILLNFHYAKFLKEQKRDTNAAILRLEDIREKSENHPTILRHLVSYYTSLDVPNFSRANIYAHELKSLAKGNQEIRLEVGEFYVKWSTSIKLRQQLDPLKEMLRQQEYKELADQAISLLETVNPKTHKVYYLLAQSYYNKWEYKSAKRLIDRAIALIDRGSSQYPPYTYFKKEIQKKHELYPNQ